jgi:hypothetical protein
LGGEIPIHLLEHARGIQTFQSRVEIVNALWNLDG